MKKSKYEEKTMGPMFPRLHVNDTDKGPRAPPRNKMALYEQLSVPSQQFSPRVLPLASSRNSPTAPSSQGTGYDQTAVNLSSSARTDRAKNFRSHPYGVKFKSSLSQPKLGKELDEDDFRPVLIEPRMGQHNLQIGKKTISPDLKIFKPTENVRGCDQGETHTISVTNLKLDLTSRNKQESNGDNIQVAKSATKVSGEVSDGQVHKRKSSTGGSRFSKCGNRVPESTRDTEEPASPWHRSDTSGDNLGSLGDGKYVSKHSVDGRTCSSLLMGNVDKVDTVSEISMVDSISHLNVTPDDVVGMIGQKHFWRARRAIVNQQRVFAIQLFELHKLIKVQQLIAGSPNLFREGCTFMDNSTFSKKLPSPYLVPLKCINECTKTNDKPNHNLERSAENAVGKAPFCSKADNQPSMHRSDSEHLRPTPPATDTKTASWSFHHPPVQQWLFPLMSPSEGLVYKPCPGPVFLGSVPGGYGPYSAMPLANHHVSPAYGIGFPAHHQGIGIVPGVSPPAFGHTNFPPYSMIVTSQSTSGSSVHQQNLYATNCPNIQISGGAAPTNLNRQNLRKVPTESVEVVPLAVNPQSSEGIELQPEIASVSEQSQPEGRNHITEIRDVYPNLHVASVAVEDCPQPHGNDQPPRPIRVVPRDGRSANESVARIFRSIQKEREQND